MSRCDGFTPQRTSHDLGPENKLAALDRVDEASEVNAVNGPPQLPYLSGSVDRDKVRPLRKHRVPDPLIKPAFTVLVVRLLDAEKALCHGNELDALDIGQIVEAIDRSGEYVGLRRLQKSPQLLQSHPSSLHPRFDRSGEHRPCLLFYGLCVAVSIREARPSVKGKTAHEACGGDLCIPLRRQVAGS